MSLMGEITCICYITYNVTFGGIWCKLLPLNSFTINTEQSSVIWLRLQVSY